MDMAIALYQKVYPGGKNDVFDIIWRPYYLNYGPSTYSVDKSELADEKLKDMTPEQREKLYKRMNQIGRAVGINFRPGGKIGDTRQAHRLVHFSQEKSPEVRNALIDKIFEAYHELEKDITSKEVLLELGVQAGLDENEVDQWLSSDEAASAVDEEAQKNLEDFSSSGVPTYVIQGAYRVEGAEDAQDFMDLFIQVKESQEST